MTRSSRFGFPLPTRKSGARVPHLPPPPIPHTVPQARNLTAVQENTSKAHKILGTSDASSVKTEKSKRWRMKRTVTNKPSFVSITVSEISDVNSCKLDVRPQEEVKSHAHKESLPQRVQMFDRDLHERPSSPLLGERYQNASNASDASSNFCSLQLHHFGSASSLHSFYDPVRSPLSVSQQTSESSARDYALRKGCPLVNGLSDHPPEQDGDSNNRQAESQDASGPKSLRRRPPRIDLSMLFPKPKAPGGPLLSPQRLTKSPSILSEASAPPLPRLSSTLTEGRTSSTNSRRLSLAEQRRREQILPFEIQASKAPRRTPKPTLAMKHWFDTFEEVHSDDELPDDTHSLAVSKPVLAQLEHRHCRHISEDTIRPQTPPGFLSKPHQNVQSSQARSPASNRSSHVQSSLLSWDDANSNPSLVSRPSVTSRKTSGSTMSSADLQQESVLCLSSSSEDEDSEPSFNLPPRRTKKSQRESVATITTLATTTYESDAVETCTAEAVSSARSRTSKINTPAAKSSSKPKRSIPRRSSSTMATTPLKVPALQDLRPNSFRLSCSFSSIEDQSQPAIPAKSPKRDEKRLSTLPATSHNPSSEHGVTKSTVRQSRIMAVTQEEESLLELMRQRRASMRQSLSQEGYMSAFDQEIKSVPDSRPRTSHNESQSSFLRMSGDLTSTTRPRTSSEHRASMQADDFLFPGPPLPRSVLRESSLFRDSRQGSIQSARESVIFGHSDALPSPSTSRASPITPTTAHSAHSAYSATGRFSKELTIPQSSSPTLERRHSRSRTHSSGVIMLDGVADMEVDMQRRSVLVEEGWPVWAVKGWAGDRGSVVVI